MSGPVRPPSALSEAARYLSDTSPGHGGRNTRPLALPALTATYCSTARTGQGATATLLGVAGGAVAWFGLAQLAQPRPSVVLAVVALVLAAAAVAGGVVLALRVVRGGSELLAALRRWHAVAPEVPVPGTDVFTSGPGLVRLVLAAAAALAGLAALVLAAIGSTLATAVGLGVAGLWLLGAGGLAGWGWLRVRAMLRSAAPQTDHRAFAPAPTAPPPTAPPPVQQWAPPGQREQMPPSPPAAAPWAPPPPSTAPATTTWQAAPEPHPTAAPAQEPDLGETRLTADTTLSRRTASVAAVLDDGTRLPSGVTLIGRDPQPRTGEDDAARQVVLHPSVSKTHAAVRVTADTIHVTDRASTNGTTVVGSDGSRTQLRPWAEQQLQPGDEVRLGSYAIRVISTG